VTIASQDPEEVARGVRAALAMGGEAHARARERILSEFPTSARREGIHAAVEAAIRSRGR
jgi:hypothetical protein